MRVVGRTSWSNFARALFAPEVPKVIRREFRIAHGVVDILVPEIGLQGPRIVAALVCQVKPAGMPQHMPMSLEAKIAKNIIYCGEGNSTS
jgi:hypothetical protein